MGKNEKALSGVAAPSKASAGNLAGQAQPHCITNGDGNASSYISMFLRHGPDHAIGMPVLAKMLDCDTRQIRKMVEIARRNGEVILINQNGFFLPSLEPEMAEKEISMFLSAWAKRLRTNRAVVRGAKSALRRLQNRDQIGIDASKELRCKNLE